MKTTRKLTDKYLQILAREAAFVDIKGDKDNVVPLKMIKQNPSTFDFPREEIIPI